MTIEFDKVKITPAMATAMLKRNNANRNISEERVARYARAITAGKFPFIGDPIREDTEGNILDGQHRLMAIEMAGLPLEVILITGIPAEYQKYMDGGRSRSAADNVRMMGIKQPTITAATARLLLAITHEPDEDGTWDGVVNVGGYSAKVTGLANHEVADYVSDHKNLETSAEIGVTASSGVQAQPTVLSFVHYLARRIDPYKADEFLMRLSTGEDLRMGSPIYAARETINRNRRDGSRDGHVNLFLLVQAWNHWRRDNEISRLQLPKGGIVASTSVVMV